MLPPSPCGTGAAISLGEATATADKAAFSPSPLPEFLSRYICPMASGFMQFRYRGAAMPLLEFHKAQ
jgi:hypothetical protein